ncbi:hypothetical protein L21SP3_02321 [Sedimentisphaera cyanobacteriorum]|uniref:Type V CRISPR-associated protein Cpf1 n=1 Tax=Sedimentisphaera cyanobacteriorum TaxID=1940790 RepID=A0A1Q2HSP0_9BACT|nr:type V CRISPR-associated protein Cas12a/Cpf1 [Sedimentisphaera cyanobacteriorum]AQQ10487.1 hypothetical protein L21SP3_02321 [Sedimentisphaera cyanobacteriorum]
MKEFTNQYSLTKTLRFELRPVGETAEKIEDFKSGGLKQTVEKDRERTEAYKQLKEVIDSYHRDFIEQAFARQQTLSEEDFKQTYQLYKEAQKEKDGETLTKQYEHLRKKIAAMFSKATKEWAVMGENNELIGKNKESKLYQWLEKNYRAGRIEKEEFDHNAGLIEYFEKFSTYFVGFDKNRANMYSKEAKATAISFRTINENMVKHFDNCQRLEKIKSKYPDLAEELKDFEEFFKPSYFINCMNQSGIDYYNISAIGGKDEKDQKANMKINLFTQKNHLKGSDKPPFFAKLYKQILSDREKSVVIDEFEKDSELTEALKNVFSKDGLINEEFFTKLKSALENFMLPEYQGQLYIRNAFLTKISANIWGSGSWGIIKDAVTQAAENNFTRKSDKEKYAKKDFYSIAELQQAIDEYIPTLENGVQNASLIEYFRKMNYKPRGSEEDAGLIEEINNNLRQAGIVLNQAELGSGKQREENIEKIKNLLDSVLNLERFLKPLYLEKEKMRPKAANLNKDFCESFDPLYEKLKTFFKLYNKVRNYATKKPYSKDKFKINFDTATLLYGWSLDKETANLSVIFRKREKFYLGIINRYNSQIFNYKIAGSESEKGLERKRSLQQKVLAEEGEDYFEKMVYHLLLGASKTIPKCSTQLKEVKAHFQKSSEDYIIQSKSFAKSLTLTKEIFDLNNLRYNTETGEISSELSDTYPKKFQKGYLTQTGDVSGYKTALHKWIDFCKEFLRCYRNTEIFTFHFKDTKEYESLDEFLKEVDSSGYEISFDKIKASYINEKVNAGELYLFEIYNKDFSEYSKGKPNLHTIYWKSLFETQNLLDKTAKLNGKAEIFFRPRSIKHNDKIIHRAGETLKNKNPLNEKPSSRFDYDITKDRRFTKDKFFLHCPITLNFKQDKPVRFNEQVNLYLKDNPDVNIIGIDRGERHLLYYTLINQNGEILQQGSLNRIGEEESRPTDYHRLLDEREKQRQQARETWKAVEGIKDLKAGYLSRVVHKLAGLMVQNNAIVVLEDLNKGFKRGRFAVEKQVYQNFEKALIQKLNYLVFKEVNSKDAPGHYLKAYQLTAPFISFEKLGTQSGFLFYVRAWNTSKIDPATGFTDQIKPKYKNQKQAKDFMSSFDSVRYNRKENYFEFEADFEKLAQKPKGRTRWTICSYGQERYSYSPKERKFVKHNVTQNLAELFNSEGISFDSGQCFKDEILKVEDASFFKSIIFNLRLLLKLRHTCKNAEIERDFIISPVKGNNSSFFDSRIAEQENITSIPQNADANGAYNIALKGLMNLHNISKDGKAKLIKDEDWIEFVQKRKF